MYSFWAIMVWATFWVLFAQTRLVTLRLTPIQYSADGSASTLPTPRFMRNCLVLQARLPTCLFLRLNLT
jgi:hypothetical protein